METGVLSFKCIPNKEVESMATSSITKNFVVSGNAQAEIFAKAIEESYQESLRRETTPNIKVTHLRGADAIKSFTEKRKKTYA